MQDNNTLLALNQKVADQYIEMKQYVKKTNADNLTDVLENTIKKWNDIFPTHVFAFSVNNDKIECKVTPNMEGANTLDELTENIGNGIIVSNPNYESIINGYGIIKVLYKFLEPDLDDIGIVKTELSEIDIAISDLIACCESSFKGHTFKAHIDSKDVLQLHFEPTIRGVNNVRHLTVGNVLSDIRIECIVKLFNEIDKQRKSNGK